jgi:hypothetical protein
MRRFILSCKQGLHEEQLGGIIVNYADDLVICCKRDADKALEVMKGLMVRLKLTVNEKKIKAFIMPKDSFVFLGYEFKEVFSFKKRKKYIETDPAEKSVKKLTDAIHDQTAKRFGWMDASETSKNRNRKIRGWANYFCTGAVSKSYGRKS